MNKNKQGEPFPSILQSEEDARHGRKQADWFRTDHTPAYHRWLIRRRVYCEVESCMKPAVRVIKRKGRDTVVCQQHLEEELGLIAQK